MRHKALILFAGSQICFWGGLAVSMALRPEGLQYNIGFSYYGIFSNTLPFYLLSLMGGAAFSLLAAKLIDLPGFRPLRYGLSVFALFTMAVALTPYVISLPIYWVHTLAGTIAFTAQMTVSLWLLAKLEWAGWPALWMLFQALAGVASLVYVLSKQGFLLQSQIGFQLAFSVMVFQGFSKLLPERR